MTFSIFKDSISKINKIELLGWEAHVKMIPDFREKELKRYPIKKESHREAAVLILFYPDQKNQTKLVLILRKTYKGVHSAQVGFPGGQVEPQDSSLQETALRETHEELGVSPKDVEVISRLSHLYIPPSNFWVYPFLGIAFKTPQFKKQETEVEDIIEVKLSDFLDDKNQIKTSIHTSYAKNKQVPAYRLNNHMVWGATAMMLSELKMLLKASL